MGYLRISTISVPILLILVLSHPAFAVSDLTTRIGGNNTGVYYPLYSLSELPQVLAAKQAYPNVPFMVNINPASGPGSGPSTSWTNAITQLKNAGAVVTGYVPTAYGTGRTVANVEGMISSYNTFYPGMLDGIMFDEVSGSCSETTFYTTISDYAKSLGYSYIRANPGGSICQADVPLFSHIAIYESGGYPSESTLASRSYYPQYSKDTVGFGATIHSTAAYDSTWLHMAVKYLKWVYITDQTEPNPYAVFPAYFNQYLTDLSTLAGSPTTITPPPIVPPTTSTTLTSTGVIIPLYIDPPSSDWDTVAQAKIAHPSVPIIAIINPSSGPGSSKDSNYMTGIKKLQYAGVTVLGYVYTSYGTRSTSSVEADIDSYKNWYNVNGIKFDEMAYNGTYASYYSNLTSYAKSLGMSMTVGNPGTDTLPSYVGTVDDITIYENPGLPSASDLAGWHTSYPKADFSFVAFGVNSLDPAYVSMASNYVGYMYITNSNLPNPYDTIPPYFGSLVAMLDSNENKPVPEFGQFAGIVIVISIFCILIIPKRSYWHNYTSRC